MAKTLFETTIPAYERLSIKAYIPVVAFSRFSKENITLMEALEECKKAGIFDNLKLLVYPYRYEAVEDNCTKDMYNFVYSKMPAGSTAQNAYRFMGEAIAKWYGIHVPPRSGTLATRDTEEIRRMEHLLWKLL